MHWHRKWKCCMWHRWRGCTTTVHTNNAQTNLDHMRRAQWHRHSNARKHMSGRGQLKKGVFKIPVVTHIDTQRALVKHWIAFRKRLFGNLEAPPMAHGAFSFLSPPISPSLSFLLLFSQPLCFSLTSSPLPPLSAAVGAFPRSALARLSPNMSANYTEGVITLRRMRSGNLASR